MLSSGATGPLFSLSCCLYVHHSLVLLIFDPLEVDRSVDEVYWYRCFRNSTSVGVVGR